MKKSILLSFAAILTSSMLFACSSSQIGTPSTPSTETGSGSGTTTGTTVAFAKIQSIVENRCVTCHGGGRTEAGINLSSPESIKAYANQIRRTTVSSRSMPEGNSTGMTQDERDLLGQWIAAGASLQ
ncbi:hypothetical protein COW36_05875 [bacterium (Candidatus Blackallbacteria) CG17_big_fil_post_rev_8_21_14_2_50_48_46]|uniref:Cytochrome c domain-containing protein n=1 Tax=bacterium (Candidatus Blackallbacteria) CG17_big_fil_post_rev_8_21_14_2_50_48_46 TaxID=2014261 RepID=A0A2M7G877_9BACT|nr:MAG: hypothetical protein COW64_21470 [bacterium (Candidatus Blackallbacteria) CG18_big_fil_WC_8_21_14_2_50_49_26]PIW18295.1 MAG: hypothetical protein COW36_05875 [bacterium (Candidatus Blackallbacteria) CG17_big_fil_post_rev_8_21_14_2_50_48_46]PIW49519.1 MAG: hypothetical protein COW20_05690 [bacterium (Candidatus Blackallbacteria) CG13_big_fil_rev_8_21_14_2_50_49_14]